MPTVHDVAAYILEHKGRMSAMKLQKLVYYSQSWSLVWDDRPMFPEAIEAWANGPVVPVLYEKHRGRFDVTDWPFGNANALDKDARETVDIVLEFYGKHNAQWLSDLTHAEDPWKITRGLPTTNLTMPFPDAEDLWKKARTGLKDGERGHNEITLESMMEYYSSLLWTESGASEEA